MYIRTYHSILFRLYWYPTKAIYSAMHVSVKVFPNGPFYLFFVPMLWGLYAMQVSHICNKFSETCLTVCREIFIIYITTISWLLYTSIKT